MPSLYYDGTFEGFLCLIQRLLSEEIDLNSVKVENLRLSPWKGDLFSESVNTDSERARIFYKSLKERLPRELFDRIYIYYLCDTAKLELPLAKVLLKVRENPNAWRDITSEEVIRLYRAEREFRRERHRWLGLLRFVELPQGILFALFEPKFNVLPKINSHFTRRFPNESFIIFDSLRGLLFEHRGRRGELLWVEGLKIEVPKDVDPYVYLWRNYFRDIAIPERESPSRQLSKLPSRVRRFLPEMWEL